MKKTFDEIYYKKIALSKANEKKLIFLGFKDRCLNKNSQVILKCEKHNKIFETEFRNLIAEKDNCYHCAHNIKSEKEIIETIENRCKNLNYCFLGFKGGKYENYQGKLILKCQKDSHVWEPAYLNFIKKNSGCPKCSKNQRIDQENALKNMINQADKNKHEILCQVDIYKNSSSKYKIKCIECNYVWETTYKCYMRKQTICRKCIGISKISSEDAINIIRNKCLERDYEFIKFKDEVFKNSNSILTLKCNKHQASWDIKYNNFIHQNNGCPTCKESKGELGVRIFLNKKNISFIPQYKFKECKYKRVLEFDFYLPDYNACIEYDGKQHFAPYDFFGGIKEFKIIKKRDKIKSEFCRKNKIKLLRIPYNANIVDSLNNFFISVNHILS